MSMSYLRELVSFSFSFSLWLILKSHEYTHTCSFVYFSEYVLLFLADNVDKKYNFQKQKVSFRLLKHLLDFFCQFQAGVAY